MPGCMGSQHPLPRTAEDAASTGDPRIPIAERYRHPEDYVARIKAAADQLVAQRSLLVEDAERYVASARDIAASMTAVVPETA